MPGGLTGERKTQWNWLINGLIGLVDMIASFAAEEGVPPLTDEQRQSVKTAVSNLKAATGV